MHNALIPSLALNKLGVVAHAFSARARETEGDRGRASEVLGYFLLQAEFSQPGLTSLRKKEKKI